MTKNRQEYLKLQITLRQNVKTGNINVQKTSEQWLTVTEVQNIDT